MTVGIVGLGLIGGSMAKSIKARTAHTVFGCDLDQETMMMARMCGAIDAPLTAENLKDCDLVLVAIRPAAAVKWVKEHAEGIRRDTILVDLCGVKRAVVRELAPVAEQYGFAYIGGHPMAAGLSLPEENVEKFRRKINENCPLTVEEVCPDIHIDMAMPVGYASTELVHQFALLEPFGKDNPSPLFADRNLSISRMWLIGKNRNVLRMSVLSEYGQPVPVIFFGDVETLFAYFTEKFGQEEVENALHGRKNRILFSMVYTAKIDFYQGNENLQLEMKYYR